MIESHCSLCLGTCEASDEELCLDRGTRISEDINELERVEEFSKKKILGGLQKAVNECNFNACD